MAHEFIASQRFAFSDLSAHYGELEDLFSRRQWHQLGQALVSFVSNPANRRGDNFVLLYEGFIRYIESKLNQLSLQQIVSKTAEQLYPTRPYEDAEIGRAIEFVSRQLDKRTLTGEDRLGDDAYLMVRMEIASLKVKRAAALADAVQSGTAGAAEALSVLLDECKKDLGEGKELHDKILDGRDPRCSAAYYRAACEYHKMRGPAHLFYENALLFLGATPLDSLSAEERVGLAVDVAVAALVGDSVYNFGEVNSHPILQSLHGTEHEWLISLLGAFQTGNIDAFSTVVASNRAAFSAQSALDSSGAVIKEKITLLAVMELAAAKPAADRAISFAEIAHETRLPADQVEWLLMRAMSLGLIRGKIDEVEQSVNVTFVKPRVLNLQQISELKDRLDGWREKARTSLLFVEDHSRDIIN